MSLEALIVEIEKWQDKSFGVVPVWDDPDHQNRIIIEPWGEVVDWACHCPHPLPRPVLAVVSGLTEELGELMRLITKIAGGIRGDREDLRREMHKELGDIFIKMVDVSHYFDIRLEQAIGDRWETIKNRPGGRNPEPIEVV